MRDIQSAAEDCGIAAAITTPEGWAALVTMMNMPEKKQESLLKKLEAKNLASIYGDLCLPTTIMCDGISYNGEAKNFRNEGMRRTKEVC